MVFFCAALDLFSLELESEEGKVSAAQDLNRKLIYNYPVCISPCLSSATSSPNEIFACRCSVCPPRCIQRQVSARFLRSIDSWTSHITLKPYHFSQVYPFLPNEQPHQNLKLLPKDGKLRRLPSFEIGPAESGDGRYDPGYWLTGVDIIGGLHFTFAMRE